MNEENINVFEEKNAEEGINSDPVDAFTEENIDFLMIATIQAAQGVLDYLIQFFTDEIVEPEEKQDFGMIL